MRIPGQQNIAASTLCALAALSFIGCDKTEPNWVQFNSESDVVELEVTGTESELGDDLTGEIMSNTGSGVVATYVVTPGSGPIGTEHLFTVVVLEDFEEIVGRAEIELDDDDVELQPFVMRQDSAYPGTWVSTLTSLGQTGDTRTDVMVFKLYQDTNAVEESATDEAAEE